MWKYVDDITVSETVTKGTTSDMQSAIDVIHFQSKDLKFSLNEDKCKEMRIQFSKIKTHCCQECENVGDHYSYIIKKASKRMYLLGNSN